MLILALALGLQAQIDQLVKGPDLAGAVVGVCVMDTQGKVVYEHDADTRLVPASNQKILTAAIALETLGPNFVWKTRFWKEGSRCIVDSPGDPTITAKQLQDVAKKLHLKPNTPVLVRAPFGQDYPEGWENDDLPNRYAARPAPFSFDRAGFEVTAGGGKLSPLLDALGVRVKLVRGKDAAKVKFNLDRRLVTVTGKLPEKSAVLDTLAQPDPTGAACALIGGVFAETTETVPERDPDAVLESQPLSVVLPTCLKPSDNHLAEQIVLTAAWTKWQTDPGPRTGAFGYGTVANIAKTFFGSYVNATDLDVHLVDGSGMSRHNLLTSRFLARVLRQAGRQGYAKVFLDSLPKPGEGTLKGRLAGLPVAAKTGTLDGVTSLSGYLWPGSSEPWTFSIVCNHTVVGAAKVRAVQDKIVKALVDSRKQP